MDRQDASDRISATFAATDAAGLGEREWVERAYEELLGYDPAAMANADARIDYWIGRLQGDLDRDTFAATFLEQAATDRGSHVPLADFAANWRAVEGLQRTVRDEGEAVTLAALRDSAVSARDADGAVERDSAAAINEAWLTRETVTTALAERDLEALVDEAYHLRAAIDAGAAAAETLPAGAERADVWQQRLDSGALAPQELPGAMVEAAVDGDDAPLPSPVNDPAVAARESEVAQALLDAAAAGDGLQPEALRAAAAAARERIAEREPDVLIQQIAAGRAGEPLGLDARISHDGGVDEAHVRISQDGLTAGTLDLAIGDEPGSHELAVRIGDPGLDPGAARITVRIDTGEETVRDHVDFGVYDDAGHDRDLALRWVDPDTDPPYPHIGRLTADQGGDGSDIGTGFLITPQHVLTSAHVVTAEPFGGDLGALDEVRFLPGLDGEPADAPETAPIYEAVEVHTRAEGFRTEWPADDIALVTLDEPVAGADAEGDFDGFWHNGAEAGAAAPDDPVHWAGYPSRDLDQGDGDFQWRADGAIAAIDGAGRLFLDDTLYGPAGASGAPVLRAVGDGPPEVVGIYAGTLFGEPVAAGVDDGVHDWALGLVRDDGLMGGHAFRDGPIAADALGPAAVLAGADAGNGGELG